jgi:hypothetical protein
MARSTLLRQLLRRTSTGFWLLLIHKCARAADRNHQLARLISQLCPSAGSACALLQPAVCNASAAEAKKFG